MKTSNWIWIGLAGTALVFLAVRTMRKEETALEIDDLIFDTDFISGSRTTYNAITDPEHPQWFMTPKKTSEDSDALFI